MLLVLTVHSIDPGIHTFGNNKNNKNNKNILLRVVQLIAVHRHSDNTSPLKVVAKRLVVNVLVIIGAILFIDTYTNQSYPPYINRA